MGPPLQGFVIFVTDEPGRCPGLVRFAPFVPGNRLSRTMHETFQA